MIHKISNIYLSERALKKSPKALIVLPYKEGIENIKKAWKGKALRLYEGLQDPTGPKESVRTLRLVERIKHLVAGLFLLVFAVNTLAILILRKEGIQRPPVFVPVPTQYVCWERVPAPYPAKNLAALDILEYRFHNKAEDIKRRIEKENKVARESDGSPMLSEKLFAAEMEKIKKETPECLLNGELVAKGSDGKEAKIQFTALKGIKAGAAETQGRRPEMEDTHLVEIFNVAGKSVELSFICDGHGGRGMAEYAKAHFVEYLMKRLKEFNRVEWTEGGILNALKVAPVDLSRSYTKDDAGATANICLKIGNRVWFDNVGDSRAILLKPNGEVVQMTRDQKADNEEFQRGIHKRGHIIFFDRLDGSLAVARALGDHGFEGGVSARGKVTCEELQEGDYYVIQACDGIWDVASTKQVGELAQHLIKQGLPLAQVAALIAKAAYQTGSGDNLSVVVRKL